MTDSREKVYVIRVQGHLDEKRAEWFGGLKITQQTSGETILTGEVVDQSALNAILNRLHGMNIKLISVDRIDPENVNDVT